MLLRDLVLVPICRLGIRVRLRLKRNQQHRLASELKQILQLLYSHLEALIPSLRLELQRQHSGLEPQLRIKIPVQQHLEDSPFHLHPHPPLPQLVLEQNWNWAMGIPASPWIRRQPQHQPVLDSPLLVLQIRQDSLLAL
jgi:hypothetical protein